MGLLTNYWRGEGGEGFRNMYTRYICKLCEYSHATVPYGIGAQGHAVGTNQRGKGPPIATGMSTPHAQGQESKNQTAGEPQRRKLQKKDFERTERGKNTTTTFSLPNCFETKIVKDVATVIGTTSRS